MERHSIQPGNFLYLKLSGFQKLCFIIGNLANLYAIISYKTPFSEMLTSVCYVLVFSCVLYAFWTLLRLLFYGIRNLFLKKKNEV
jgi:hypothetical protein